MDNGDPPIFIFHDVPRFKPLGCNAKTFEGQVTEAKGHIYLVYETSCVYDNYYKFAKKKIDSLEELNQYLHNSGLSYIHTFTSNQFNFNNLFIKQMAQKFAVIATEYKTNNGKRAPGFSKKPRQLETMTGFPVFLENVDAFAFIFIRKAFNSTAKNEISRLLCGGVINAEPFSNDSEDGVNLNYVITNINNNTKLVHFYIRYCGIYEIILNHIRNKIIKKTEYFQLNVIRDPTEQGIMTLKRVYNDNLTVKNISLRIDINEQEINDEKNE